MGQYSPGPDQQRICPTHRDRSQHSESKCLLKKSWSSLPPLSKWWFVAPCTGPEFQACAYVRPLLAADGTSELPLHSQILNKLNMTKSCSPASGWAPRQQHSTPTLPKTTIAPTWIAPHMEGPRPLYSGPDDPFPHRPPCMQSALSIDFHFLRPTYLGSENSGKNGATSVEGEDSPFVHF